MAGVHIPTYPILVKYIDDTLSGMGALKGANCTIYSIERTTQSGKSGSLVTFEWEDTEGAIHQDEMFVPDGQPGTDGKDGKDGVDGKDGKDGVDGKDGTPIYPWQSGHPYIIGDLVIYSNNFYQCISENSDVEWTSANWQLIGTSGGGGLLTRSLTASVDVGGIHTGDEYQEGDSIEDLLHDMLDPVKYPTLTPPSASLTWSSPMWSSTLVESGSSDDVYFEVAFNRGSINPAYGTSGYRSGELTGIVPSDGQVAQGSNYFYRLVSENNNSFSCRCDYAAGEQPKDSKGGNYGSPLPAGSVNTGTITFEFVDALWASTDPTMVGVEKQPLVRKSAKKAEFDLVPQTENAREIIDIPHDGWTLDKIYVFNTLSNQWDDATDQFDVLVNTVTHEDAGGNSKYYDRYYCNLPYDLGTRKVRITWR